jgi:predicted GIY-YIG superfamily endonuclease
MSDKYNNTNIYILELENNKYYVGKSYNPTKRFYEHLRGYGSTWTQLYRPLRIIQVFENVSHFDEDKYTKEYMAIYGIENVRGGSYTSVKLSAAEYDILLKEIWSAHDKCILCGQLGHFANKCFLTIPRLTPIKITCYKCGKNGHYSYNCYSLYNIDGEYITY